MLTERNNVQKNHLLHIINIGKSNKSSFNDADGERSHEHLSRLKMKN